MLRVPFRGPFSHNFYHTSPRKIWILLRPGATARPPCSAGVLRICLTSGAQGLQRRNDCTPVQNSRSSDRPPFGSTSRLERPTAIVKPTINSTRFLYQVPRLVVRLASKSSERRGREMHLATAYPSWPERSSEHRSSVAGISASSPPRRCPTPGAHGPTPTMGGPEPTQGTARHLPMSEPRPRSRQ